MTKPRIIVFDLETLPNLAEVLKVYPGLGNYPGLTLKASITSILCAGYKVLGAKRTSCINAWDFPSRWAKDVNDDYMVVKQLREVLLTADAIVTHNGKRFDWKHLQTRLMCHGLAPLPPIPHIDTCAEAKKHLYLFNNRLNTLGDFLTGEEKLEHEGWKLWVKAYNRERKALETMEQYCKQDVALTEKVFMRLRPFVKNLPMACKDQALNQCRNCGSYKMQKAGIRTKLGETYQRYKCNSCGSWFKGETFSKLKPILKHL